MAKPSVQEPSTLKPKPIALLGRVIELLERSLAGDVEGLDAQGAADFCGVSVSKWHAMNADGAAPAPVQLGDRCPRWVRSELKCWMLAGCPTRQRWVLLRDAALRRAS